MNLMSIAETLIPILHLCSITSSMYMKSIPFPVQTCSKYIPMSSAWRNSALTPRYTPRCSSLNSTADRRRNPIRETEEKLSCISQLLLGNRVRRKLEVGSENFSVDPWEPIIPCNSIGCHFLQERERDYTCYHFTTSRHNEEKKCISRSLLNY